MPLDQFKLKKSGKRYVCSACGGHSFRVLKSGELTCRNCGFRAYPDYMDVEDVY